MTFIIQRVIFSKLIVDNQVRGEINNGYLIYLGIVKNDYQREREIIDQFLKIKFIEDEGKFKISLNDKKYPLMIIPNITLISNLNKKRIEFKNSPSQEIAQKIFNNFINLLREKGFYVISGVFGAQMIIESQNLGPINFIFEL
jgi:D-tyrosyl-tRNA(Tyr) deacylase